MAKDHEQNIAAIVQKMASLARISIPEAEKERYTKKAGAILNYVELLKEIDVSKVEAMSHAVEMNNNWREDEIVPSTLADTLLEQAPEKDGRYFQVPKVIDNE